MNSTQLIVGNSTEKLVSALFRQKGYWVLNVPKNGLGSQPVDIVAIKGGSVYNVYLVDAKHVRENEVSFKFDRVEANQITSMCYARDYAKLDKNNLGFAILFEREQKLMYLPLETFLERQKQGLKSIKMEELKELEEIIK